MKHAIGLCLGLLISSQVMAFGEPGRWVSGWGQGNTELAATDAKGNQLYFSCNGTDAPYVSLTVHGKDYGAPPARPFTLIVDGQVFTDLFSTDSHAGSQQFQYVWDKLRQAKSLQARTADGQLVTLPLAGVTKVLVPSRSKNFPCSSF